MLLNNNSSGGVSNGNSLMNSTLKSTSSSFKIQSTSTTTNPSFQPPQPPPRNGAQFPLVRTNTNGANQPLIQRSASSNNPGHFRTRSFSSTTTGADHDPYGAQQQGGYNRNTGLSTSFTPPDTFDLKDYELLFIEHKRHVEQQQKQNGVASPGKFNLQLPLQNMPAMNSSSNTTPRGNVTTPRGATTPRNGTTTPRRNNGDQGDDGVSEEENNPITPEQDTRQVEQSNTSSNQQPVNPPVQDSIFQKVTLGGVNKMIPTKTTVDSSLSMDLRPRRNPAIGGSLLHDNSSNFKQANQSVRYIATFVPHKRGGVHKVNVPIPTVSSMTSLNFTATDLIRKALELYKRETDLEPIAIDDRAYQLRVAEEDGQPDTSWPPLNKEKTMIEQLGNVKLTLVLDRNFQPMSSGNSGAEDDSSSNLKNRRELNIKFGGDEVFTKFNLEDIRLQVFLPPPKNSCSTPTIIPNTNSFTSPINSRNYQLTYFKLVPVSPELLLKDLQKVLCQRFSLDPKKYMINTIGKDKNLKEISKNYKDKTLYSLGSMIERVVLVRTAAYESDTDQSTPKGEISGSPTAPNMIGSPSKQIYALPFMTYDNTDNVFHVTKTNKFGVRQERILSFDSEFIYNSKPANTSRWMNSSKTKHPTRPITTLRSIECDSTNPKCFVLSFDDENLFYEARTTIEAETIVKRLEQLLLMKNHPLYGKNRNSLVARALSDLTPRR
ncbi:predicted protein [Naegleria gruberi]|uniref:Predicted protein n=1 Tax=Naegleria gruberi TaxID=5762 RepID=D2VAT1_NAEGR|nr:uncharacterized protein NAEGRDRAFT_65965 [Naegleria gruberi]EFC46133.1 predicted protein [Naegleria gruberi]|eukprot:XP_002678877.1 predicted protein [Naegleria gruberi strain NEG-M]